MCVCVYRAIIQGGYYLQCDFYGTNNILLAHDFLSSSAYPVITHSPPVAGNLLIEILVVKQQPTMYSVMHKTFTHVQM